MAIAATRKHVIVAAVGGVALTIFSCSPMTPQAASSSGRSAHFVSTGFDNEAVAVDIEARRAFVAGWVRWLPGSNNQEAFLVRAYDTDSGILRLGGSVSQSADMHL